MKQYPSIEREIQDKEIYAFDKLDGSNIRAEWHPKKGFWKFGSRSQLIDLTSPFGESITLIKEQEDRFNIVFKEHRVQEAVVFFEYYGENSFAGNHENEPHVVTMIDISVYKQGFLNPNEYLKMFKGSEIPQAKLLYRGKPNSDFISQVRTGVLEGMTFEGVVCKGNRDKPSHPPIMFKVKNQAWIDKLRSFCKTDEEFNKLL